MRTERSVVNASTKNQYSELSLPDFSIKRGIRGEITRSAGDDIDRYERGMFGRRGDVSGGGRRRSEATSDKSRSCRVDGDSGSNSRKRFDCESVHV